MMRLGNVGFLNFDSEFYMVRDEVMEKPHFNDCLRSSTKL